LLTNYYGLTHPSQPNYIASVGGDYFGLDHDDVVDIPSNVSTVVDLFDTKNIDWREYMEDAPGPGYMGAGSADANGRWIYVRKHKYVFDGRIFAIASITLSRLIPVYLTLVSLPALS
jgi:hypothetical protein